MDKSLPANLEAERATLGSVLLNREAIIAIASWLLPDDFYAEQHAWMFEAMLACYNARVPPDIRTVSDELRRRERLDAVGGIAVLAALIDGVPTSYHVEYYARIVQRTALLRKLIGAGGKIAALGYDEQDDVEATLDRAETVLFEVSQRRASQDFVHISQVIDSYYEQINFLQEHRGEVVGVPTGFKVLDEMTGGLQRSDLVIVAARPGVGKCLAAWTLIDDPLTGERLTIEHYVKRRLPVVHGISATGCVRPTVVSHWIESGVQPCYRVTTRTGRTLDATANHPFLTALGWTPLSELTAGRAIAVPRAVPAFGSDENWPIGLVRLLAYFIAEGGLTRSSPGFTNTDPILIEDFKTLIAAHFPDCAVRQHAISYFASRPGRGKYRSPNPIYVWLAELGLQGKLSKDKVFPACVWRWSRRYLAEFLRVLMSCDGSIYEAEEKPRIEFTVASEQLARDVHHAFIRFGYSVKFYRTTTGAWRVEMTEQESIARYQHEIGWIGEKNTRFVDYVWNITRRGGNKGHAPQETWALVRSAAKAQGLSLIELARRSGETTRTGKYAGYSSHTNRTIPRWRLTSYAEVLEDDELRRIASTDIYWDEIVSIEAIGNHQVYDLTVPDGANFIAQDVCAHNTSFCMSVAYNIALQGNGTVGVFSLEMSREQLVQRLLAMETKIDTHKIRTGHIRDAELAQMMEAMGKLAAIPIYIEDSAGMSVMEVRSKARRLQAQSGVDLIIIDYLQLMQGRRADGNRVQEVSEISRGLKAMARELNVPVIALSQLSRAVEGRASHVPMLSDLRESGCLAGETLVYLPDEGVYKRIDSLVGQTGFNVLALNTETWKLEPKSVLKAFATGQKPVFKLTTRLNRAIRATANHKFLTIEGWKRLDELAPGMRIALPRTLPGTTQTTMSDAELALLGHMIGDGCMLARQPIHYTTNELALGELVANLASEVFGDAVRPRVQRELRWYQVYLAAKEHLTHGKRNPVAAWLDSMSIFDLRSHEKRVPDCVFAQPAQGIAKFLRHLWATDGCVHLSVAKITSIKVYYASSSPQLARDVQSLLLRLGINATIFRYAQNGKGRDQYHVSVGGKPDVERFIEQIGALGAKKEQHQAAIIDYLSTIEAKTGRDVVPHEVWHTTILPAIKRNNISNQDMLAKLGYSLGSFTIAGQNLSRERAARIAQAIEGEELARLSTSDVYWDKIVAIEPDGEAEVYDLTVEGLHNFIANDIVVSNSIEQDADIVMFIYREELYDPNTDKKGIAEIHIAKHRNGPVGVVPMHFDPSTTQFHDLSFRTPDGY